MKEHRCAWSACHRRDTVRLGYWGQWYWLCPEHEPLIGDDGSMDEPPL